MTGELVAQRERLVQAERVAAWRELARRLAHELKNPLFPLQITVENMQRARDRYPEQFDEVFREGTATLLAELAQLKQIVGRFSDFARMPAPEIQPVDVQRAGHRHAEAVRRPAGAGARSGRHGAGSAVRHGADADPEQMTRVLRNLMLNAIDAMPEGGTLTVRTTALDGRRAAGDLRHRAGPDARGMRRASSRRTTRPRRTARGWAWRSCNPWSATTGGEFRWRAKRARAQRSGSNLLQNREDLWHTC